MSNNLKNKILFIGSFPPPYHGSNVYFYNLVNHPEILEKFNVSVLDTSDPRHDLENLGRIDFTNIKTAVKNLFQLCKLCRRKKPDLIYINTPQGVAYLREGLFVLIIKLFSKAKIIQHLHGSEFLNYYGRANLFMKILISATQKHVDYSIVLGENLKYIFKKWNKTENIFSVPNGIPDLNIESKNFNGRLPELLFFGNLYKFKGLILTLDVMEIIKKEYPDIKLNIAGEWGYDWYFNLSQKKMKEIFYSEVEKKNLKENINFIGPAYDSEKIKVLENSDILIYPTYMDGFPIVLLEAMAAGCPVVTAKTVGAISEIVVNNETGFLIPDYNENRYAEAILQLLKNPGLLKEMSDNAKKRFREKYTLDDNIKRMSNIFGNILNG